MENTEKQNTETVEVIEKEMDFGFENDGSSKYKQVYFVKPMLKDGAKFQISWSEGNKKYITTTKQLQGKLIKIEQSSYEYDKETIETLKIHIEWMNKAEEPVLFILGTSYTSVARNLLNSLVDCKQPINKLSLTLYDNAEGYASLYTMINGAKSQWKYDWKTLNEKVEEIKHPKTGKVLQRDYTELNEFLKDDLFSMIDVIIPNHRKVIPEQAADNFFDKEKPVVKTEKKVAKAKPKKAVSKNTKLKSPDDEENFFGEEDSEGFFDLDEN